ncbi:cation:proton antiporter domain-containing protein [Azohydromonas caseinilytica]|uniref:Cation/H+ exchanger transmembrane domain-containing protein n=1 Tax=Azohydromonas caseinilytica TaxID=2728836 RepID=A0A848FFM9_9BURK|nr:cation:proton antiporter [Azohydromonas caseinilytica]NML18174.1 hypothetical protein [Azohydromonas caseinilytica]
MVQAAARHGPGLTWGGLRGGISLALALSIPSGTGRDLLVPLTCAVVVISVLVQGLSIGKVVKASMCQSAPGVPTAHEAAPWTNAGGS